MIIVINGEIDGNTEDNLYHAMKPWRHACGVGWWTCTNADGVYEYAELTGLTQRTLAEIEATAEYIAWARQQVIDADAQSAHTNFEDIPNWLKTFTTADIDAYVETNVTNLATAKVALAHLGKAIIIIRNYLKLRT